MTITISRVSLDRRPIALRLLFARFPVEEQQTRLSDALQSAERGSLNLDYLLLAEENGQPVGAALTMHQTDGVTLVWPPAITCQTSNGPQVEEALMKRICDDIDLSGSKMAQALLSLDDSVERELLEQHGFTQISELFFLARVLSATDLEPAPENQAIDYEVFSDANSSRFASTIDLTYQESLDCPRLDGFRNGKDSLVSHRLSGRFDPAGWRLYRLGSQEIGVLLMNDHPDQNAIELVYFGIVPEFRGQGLGRQILSEGLQAAARTGRAAMFLAVDCGNVYANNLYSEFGFTELARRRVMVRRSA